ncbi:MAG: acyl-CoA dehydrogenase [Pirellulales bacterium]
MSDTEQAALTTNFPASPIAATLWEQESAGDWLPRFESASPSPPPADVAAVLKRSLSIVQRHREQNRLHDRHGKIAADVLEELGPAGYWGLRVGRAYGGWDLPWSHFYPFLTQMATQSATIAGLASVHGCIGAAGAVSAFGTDAQKSQWLPLLAKGEKHTAFALTEPQAGTDLTAVATRAERHGSMLRLYGEKTFISNLAPGRLIVLIGRIDDRPAALLVDLPTAETPEFRLRDYGLYALRRSLNRGMELKGLAVSADNVLAPPKGDGLTIAYHGLNRGRVAVCAVAAGQLRVMLGSVVEWVQQRSTYGAALARRELIRRRLSRLAGLLFGADALAAWCGSLLDAGVRGEAECTVAKVFGSEALKEAAIELVMKTHGGRSFLHGHLWGDNLYDYLTPCIYEGEGEILSLALFRMLAPRSNVLALPYSSSPPASRSSQNAAFVGWAEFARAEFRRLADEYRRAIAAHGAALVDRQCLLVEWSQRLQKTVVLSVVAAAGARESNAGRRWAAEHLAADLERELSGRRADSRDFERADRLGAWLTEGGADEWRDAQAPN